MNQLPFQWHHRFGRQPARLTLWVAEDDPMDLVGVGAEQAQAQVPGWVYHWLAHPRVSVYWEERRGATRS